MNADLKKQVQDRLGLTEAQRRQHAEWDRQQRKVAIKNGWLPCA